MTAQYKTGWNRLRFHSQSEPCQTMYTTAQGRSCPNVHDKNKPLRGCGRHELTSEKRKDFSLVSIKTFFTIFLATGLLWNLTGCQNRDMPWLSWTGDSPAAGVQTMSVNGMDTINTYAGNVCVIPKKKAKVKEGMTSFTSLAQLCVEITEQKSLYANNIYERLYPASLTKLFTAYVVLKKGNLDDIVTISKNAANIRETGAKLCGLEEGDQVSLRDLLKMMLVYSGNDAALAIAEHIEGSEENFAKVMNTMAASIGAVDSHFVNSHGLHQEEHYTTAYDIYLVMNELVKNQDFVDIIHMANCEIVYKDVTGNEKRMSCTNTNQYLTGAKQVPEDITIIGGKTGNTLAAGACLAMYSRDLDGNEYISVIMKAVNNDTVFGQMSQLLLEVKEKEIIE